MPSPPAQSSPPLSAEPPQRKALLSAKPSSARSFSLSAKQFPSRLCRLPVGAELVLCKP